MITHPAWGLASLSVGLLTAYLLRKIPHASCFHQGRHQNLDGLRGVLALIVFICHASTWQQYLIERKWRVSDTPFYILPGQTSIVIFLMLTAFLLTKKLLTSVHERENWIHVYTSRVLRLAPVYAVMLIVLATLALYQTWDQGGQWHTCAANDFFKWMAFTLPGAPQLCDFKETNVAVSGVTWSLTYEWAFYFSLPFLSVLTGKRPAWGVLLVCGLLLWWAVNAIPFYTTVYFSFALGMTSAFIDFYRPSCRLQHSNWASAAALLLLVSNSFWHTNTSYTETSVLVIFLAFHIFASGNTLMGILCSRTFQVFGLCAYSIYLFHGLLLYLGLNGLLILVPSLPTNNLVYWNAIVFMTPVLIGGSLGMYLYVEHPPMQRTKQVSTWLQKRLEQGYANVRSAVCSRFK